MKKGSFAFVSGLVFAVGLGISGMTQPSKVKGFLDITGAWDASLAFVMIGAIGVNLVAYRAFILRRGKTLFGEMLKLPTRSDIDTRLVLGAAIFGIGWGLGGYCPGPGLTSLATTSLAPLLFVAAMALGMLLQHLLERSTKPVATTSQRETVKLG